MIYNKKPDAELHPVFCYMAERMRLERTMPCGTPHFQCGSLPLEYLSVSSYWRLSYYIETVLKNQALIFENTKIIG